MSEGRIVFGAVFEHGQGKSLSESYTIEDGQRKYPQTPAQVESAVNQLSMEGSHAWQQAVAGGLEYMFHVKQQRGEHICTMVFVCVAEEGATWRRKQEFLEQAESH